MLDDRTKAVEFGEHGIDVRRDPHALEFLVFDGHRHNAVLLPQPTDQLACVHAVDLHHGDRAREARLEAGVQADAVIPEQIDGVDAGSMLFQNKSGTAT